MVLRIRGWAVSENSRTCSRTASLSSGGSEAASTFPVANASMASHTARSEGFAVMLRRLSWSLQVVSQPGVHGAPPELGVLRLQDPVALVGIVEKFRAHSPALQGRIKLQALLEGDAVVERAVDDERGRLEVGGEIVRRPALVHLLVRPRRAAELPLGKPQLFGGAVLAGQVVDPGVGKQAAEAVSVAQNPVGHVAAVAAPARADAGLGPAGQRLDVVHHLYQVNVHPAAPVAADFVHALLPPAGETGAAAPLRAAARKTSGGMVVDWRVKTSVRPSAEIARLPLVVASTTGAMFPSATDTR